LRVNLICRPEQARAGYMNMSENLEELPDYEFTHTQNAGNLSAVALPGELTELVAQEVLERFAPDEADVALDNWVASVGIGGTLAITCLDITTLCQDHVIGRLNAAQLNRLLHGDGRRASYSLSMLAEALQARGLKVIRRNLHGHQFCVVARRES